MSKKGKEDVTKELKLHHNMTTYIPVHRKDMVILTKKRDDRVKAHTLGDGSKQKIYPEHTKDNYSCLTCNNKSVMIAIAIDAHKDRHVVVIDWTGAYLHAHLPNDIDNSIIYMLLEGKLAELMAVIYQKLYCQYVTINKKEVKQLNVCMNKALCGAPLANDVDASFS